MVSNCFFLFFFYVLIRKFGIGIVRVMFVLALAISLLFYMMQTRLKLNVFVKLTQLMCSSVELFNMFLTIER